MFGQWPPDPQAIVNCAAAELRRELKAAGISVLRQDEESTLPFIGSSLGIDVAFSERERAHVADANLWIERIVSKPVRELARDIHRRCRERDAVAILVADCLTPKAPNADFDRRSSTGLLPLRLIGATSWVEGMLHLRYELWCSPAKIFI